MKNSPGSLSESNPDRRDDPASGEHIFPAAPYGYMHDHNDMRVTLRDLERSSE